MSGTTSEVRLEVRNPAVIVNGSMGPTHALLADLREEQSSDIRFFDNIVAYLGTLDRSVHVGYYTNQPGSSESYTHSPLEPSQIVAICPRFQIENYHTSFLDLLTLITASPYQQQMYNSLRPLPSVRPDLTWCTPDNLNLDIRIHEGGHSRFEYSALGLKLLEVNSNVNSFVKRIDIFRPFISVDDTGLYQEATAEVLEERVKIALAAAGSIDDFNFKNRFRQYASSMPYHRSLEVAKNVARRMNPKANVDERKIVETYDISWNSILQQRLPDMVRKMQYDLSAIIQNHQERLAPFGDTYSQALDVIVDRILRGVVSLDPGSMQVLGQVIVLNHLYEGAQNQKRVERIRDEISGNQEEIRELARRSGELLEEMREVQFEVNAECGRIEKGMKGRLEKVFNDTYQIDSLVRDTRPLEITEEPGDEIPF